MDVGERWQWMLRCGGFAQDKTVINRIMLRFRPIAPKPAGDSGSGGSFVDNKSSLLYRARSKRKYVRVRKNTGHKRRKRASSLTEEKVTATLQLLPEENESNAQANNLNHPVNTNINAGGAVISESINYLPQPWVNHHNRVIDNTCNGQGSDLMVMVKREIVESWVTVECVTDITCMEARAMGHTDVERMKNLEGDSCPGFISDSLNRVQWVNVAYRRMLSVREGKDGRSPEMRVWLVVKENLPCLCPAFSCKVRVQYTWQKEKWSRTVPCDVWRMDSGEFAWRLDVEAALTLGR
ncbi:hypothetical protein SLA2020_077460 [Shorea laevis]